MIHININRQVSAMKDLLIDYLELSNESFPVVLTNQIEYYNK